MDPHSFWSVALFLVGACIICLEMFLPSGGVLGFLAAGSLIASVAVAFTGSMALGVSMMAVLLLAIPALLAALVRVWPHTPIGKRILIQPKTTNLHLDRGLKALEGCVGVAKTKMLPSGSIVINGQVYDAVSDGLPIDPGQAVRIVSVTSNRLLVRPATPAEAFEAATSHHATAAPGSPADSPPPPATPRQKQRGVSDSAVRDANEVLSRPLDELGLEGLEDGFQDR